MRSAVALLALIWVAAGCSEIERPPVVRSYRHVQEEDLTTRAPQDTVRLMVGVANWVPVGQDTTRIYLDLSPAPDDSLRLSLGIEGVTYDPCDRAVVEFGWSGDTLRVWCGYEPSRALAEAPAAAKTSYPPPWFVATRVGVTLPAGVTLRYLGRWFE